jgi:hypothetical protein
VRLGARGKKKGHLRPPAGHALRKVIEREEGGDHNEPLHLRFLLFLPRTGRKSEGDEQREAKKKSPLFHAEILFV